MKKRFHFYCMLFLLSVGCGIAIDTITEFKDFVNGFSEGWHDADVDWGKEEPYKYKDINVFFRPKSFRLGDATLGTDSVYNVLANEKEAVNYNQINVHVSKDKVKMSSLGENLIGFGCILYSVGFIGFWVIFIMIVRSFSRGDVFLHSVANRVTKAAVFLIISYLAQWIVIWGSYELAVSMVQLEGYEIVPHYQYDNSLLYTGFGLILLAQIIKYGKEMKEENELTI